MQCNFVRSLTGALVLVAALAACAPDASTDGRDVAQATQAVVSPDDSEFYPLRCADGSTSDVPGDTTTGNRERDIVGDEAYPAFYRTADEDNLYLRMRVDLDPSGSSGGLQPSGWDVLFDADGDLRTYEYMLTADGNLGGTRVQWLRNSVQEPMNPGDRAEDLVHDLTPAGEYYSVRATGDGSNFGGDPDFFVTLAIPRAYLVAAGIDLGHVVAWAGTSAQSYGLNGDVNCSSTFPASLEDVAPPPASADPHVPDAAADAFTALEDTPKVMDVLANDWGLLDEPITVTITSQPAHGTAVVNADGTVTYTPNPNWNGTDSFSYQVADADGQTSTGTVTVTVTPVDDGPPVAVDDLAQTPMDAPVTTAVLANDTVVDAPATVAVAEEPQHGTATANANGTITYTPAEGWSGTDSYRYSVTDIDAQTSVGTVTVTVTSPTPPPADGGPADGDAPSDNTATADGGASPGEDAGAGTSPSDGASTSLPATEAIGVAGGGCSGGPGGAASALLIGLLALARRRR